MSRPMCTVLLALSLVLAGCNGLALDNGTPERTLTPAGVPTDEPTPTPVPQLTPGLSGEGVTDAFTLAEAHAAILDNQSYTVRSNTGVQYTNGTVFNNVTTQTQYATNDSRFYRVQNGTRVDIRGSSNVSIWSDGERVLFAWTRNNSTSYNIPRNENGEPRPPREVVGFGSGNERIAELFSSVETRVTDELTRNGTTLYRVEATEVTNLAAFESEWQNPRNFSMTALVDSRGLVHEYRLHYTATLDGDTVTVTRRVRYTALGNTTVERPPWYDEAIENVSTTNLTAEN